MNENKTCVYKENSSGYDFVFSVKSYRCSAGRCCFFSANQMRQEN